MAYFSDEFFRFFFELSQSNNKEWFDANRKRYEKEVKKPFYQFSQDLADRIKLDLNASEVHMKRFRINRDIRFSKDKTPYKTHVAAMIRQSNAKNMGAPGFYVHFGLENSFMGGGAYQPDKHQLLAIRRAIAADPDAFHALTAAKEFKDTYGNIRGEKNKRLPKEFREAADQHPILFNKQFYFMKEYEDSEWLLREELMEFVMNHYQAQRELMVWLQDAMA
jgi:uncharacterized protein (TIGR02453 family)